MTPPAMREPTLRVALPEHWRPYSARDVVVLARPPVDTGWFCTTMLIAQEEAPASIPLPALLEATSSALVDLGDDVEVLGGRYVVGQDLERVSRLVSFDPRDGERGGVRGGVQRIAQLQCFVAPRVSPPASPTRPVAQFVGTCAFDELDRYGPAFVDVIGSIGFDGGQLTAG